MKLNAKISRRTDADALVSRMIVLAQAKAENRFGCVDRVEVQSFALGYLGSLLAQVAAMAPAALKELEGAVAYAEKNQ